MKAEEFGLLTVSGVEVAIGDFVLRANFRVEPGERAAVIGPSGSGKTSLLRILAGLIPLSRGRGEIFLGQKNLSQLDPEKREIGFVFQDQALFQSMSVIENVAYALRCRGISKKQRRAQVLPWLERLNLVSKADSPVSILSGGERQRIALLRAIVWRPQLLLLDEPFSALDTATKARVRSELLELHQLWPVPLIIVSHDAADVAAIATSEIQFSASPDGSIREFSKVSKI